jgi:hypothetical protein
MNIKDLKNYQMITNNTDSPILVGTPQFFTFVWSSGDAFAPYEPNAGYQSGMLQSALSFVQFDVIDSLYNEYEPGSGAWWYLKGYDVEFVPKSTSGSSTTAYWMYKVHIFRVADENIPATSPSGV